MTQLSPKHSFFLFGARGTGKSTLVESKYHSKHTLWIDLLLYEEEEKFSQNPDNLLFIIRGNKFKKVVIDEVQKIPKLLDIVQILLRKQPGIQFIMTGSSARKLRRGSANLLAGRAFQYYLFPISIFELDKKNSLNDILEYGTLPEVLQKESDMDKKEFLKSYVQTYLKEELISEQLIRNLNPFRNFLHIVAQQNGQIINYSNIARDIKADDKTVKNYFSILEDTLLGFVLPCYHQSVRRQQTQAPKFYLFDTGVKRALDKGAGASLTKGTYAYGRAFEHRVILECFYLNEYFRKNFNFYYMKTKDQSEVDLIVERPGKKDVLIEIKSTSHVHKKHSQTLCRFQKDWPQPCEAQIWSEETQAKKIDNVKCFSWKDGLKKLFF